MVCSRRGSVINTLRQKSQPASRCQCKLGIATGVMERSYYKPPWLHPCTLLLPAPGQNKCQLGTSHPHIGLHGTEWLLIPAPAALLKLLPPVSDCSPWKIDEVLSSSAGVRCKEPGSFLSPSSRKLRSIILLRSTAALSSALNVQPMAAAGEGTRPGLTHTPRRRLRSGWPRQRLLLGGGPLRQLPERPEDPDIRRLRHFRQRPAAVTACAFLARVEEVQPEAEVRGGGGFCCGSR